MTAQGSAALAWAKANAIGRPYVYAGVGPNDYDCSGLTQTAYKKGAGISLPRTSQEQRTAGQSIPLSQAQPGDLVTFSYPGESGNPAPANHVVMYVNPTTVFAASHSGIPVGYAPLDTAHLDRVIRVGGSSAASTSAAFSTQLAGGSLGTVEPIDSMQLAGYESVLNLTPWGIPLNPLKLPGYLAGKAGSLAGEAGTPIIQGIITGFVQALGPLFITLLAAGAGLGLIALGLWRASQPARTAVNEKAEQAAQVAAVAA